MEPIFSRNNDFCKEEIVRTILHMRRTTERGHVISVSAIDYLEAAIQSLIKNYEASDQ